MNKSIVAVIFVSILLLISCKKVDDRLIAIEKDGLYGYINTKGDTVIKCIYPLSYTDTIYQIGFVADKRGNIKCFNKKGNFLFFVYKYDNGPDYFSDGLFRIVDNQGLIGFADTLGRVVISPQFKYAFPSINGKAKVTKSGMLKIDSSSTDFHEYWESKDWYYIEIKNKKQSKNL